VLVRNPEKGNGKGMETSRVPKGPQDPKLSYEWKLKKHCVAFSKDVIRVIPFYSRLATLSATRKKIDDFKFDAEAVFRSCPQQTGSSQDFEYKQDGSDSTLFLSVTLRGLRSANACEAIDPRNNSPPQIDIPDPLSFDDIDKLGEEIDALSPSSFKLSDGNKKALQDVFSSITVNVDFGVLDTAVKALKTLAAAHPIINIVFKALLVPYEMSKQQHEFVEDSKTLASDICASLKSAVDAFPHMTLKSAKDPVLNLVKVIAEASHYLNEFLKKGAAGRLTAAQFPQKLDDYRSSLRDCRLDFREAVLVQNLVNSKILKDRGDDMSFLQRKLKSAEQLSIDGGCLPGTRKTYLSDVKTARE